MLPLTYSILLATFLCNCRLTSSLAVFLTSKWCILSYFQFFFNYSWFGFFGFFVFNGISTLFRLSNAKAIFLEEQQWYYLTHSWEDKRAHTFPKDICPKVNVIARLEYHDSAVQRFNHYTTRTPHLIIHGFQMQKSNL